MTQPQYKKLSTSDVPLMRQLLALYGEAFEMTDVYQGAPPSDGYLESLLDRDDFITIVAMNGDTVIGGLCAYVIHKFERERKEIYVYDLAVAAEHRRQGVATNMIKELGSHAKELGAYVIIIQADQGDEPAIKLYESLGTKEDVHHFDIRVV